jgi:Ca2+-binding EF-hand superfamily protein
VCLLQPTGSAIIRLIGTDPEHEILQAFECFDEKNDSTIDGEQLREYLTTMGDRFTDEEVDIMFKEMLDNQGRFHYRDFVHVLKHGYK